MILGPCPVLILTGIQVPSMSTKAPIMGELTRRRFVTGVVLTTTVAGCSGRRVTDSRAPPDVVVFNNTSTDKTASVTIGPKDGDPFVSEQVSIKARGAAEYEDVLPPTGAFSLSVDVQDGPAGHGTRTLSSESESFQAIIESETVRFRVRE